MTTIEALATAFRALTRKQRANLLWHLEHKTPICCGKDSELYTDGEGGG